MKKLTQTEIHHTKSLAPTIQDKVAVDFRKLPFIFEIQAHDRVVVDVQPTFINAAKVFKECRDHHIPVKLFKINNTTGFRTQEFINPLY